MMPTIAILAGGLATRLYPKTMTIPKAMLEVLGEPFISHQMLLVKNKGITRVVLCVGHYGQQIRDYVKNGYQFGLSIEYSFDGDKLLGTGGALRNALPLLDDFFWVMYGDSYLNTDFRSILDYFITQDKLGLMTVFKNEDEWDRSNILYMDRKIVSYDKRNPTPDMKHIDYGLALLRKEAVEEIAESGVFDLADLYKRLIERGEMLGYEVNERFYEIGSLEGLQETSDYLWRLNQQHLEEKER